MNDELEPQRLTRRAAVLLTIAFVVGGGIASGVVTLVVRSEINRDRAVDDCRQDVTNRDALRAVVREAFADEDSPPVTLTPDPRVPPEFIDYLQDLINGMGTDVDRSEARDRLLARAPRLGCSEDGESFEIPEPDRESAP